MASLALGLVGGLIGGPAGYLVGSLLGSLLFPQKVDGPRLSDLHLHTSSYGGMTPILYGTMRVAGNIDWQTDLTEHKSTSGGKGGPETTTYTYSASFGVTLCEGPIAGIGKIWANGRKIYDRLNPVANQGQLPITVYLGTETQLPDPTMQAHLDPTSVPAYRGLARVVFTDWLLTDYSNAIPSLNFEVFTNAGSIPWRVSTFTPPNPTPNAALGASYDSATGHVVIGYYTAGFYNEVAFDMLTGASVGGVTTLATDPIFEPADSNLYPQNGGNLPNAGAQTAIQGHNGIGCANTAYYKQTGTGTGIGGIAGGCRVYDNGGLFQGAYTYMVDYVAGTGIYLERWPSDSTTGAITASSPDASYFLGTDSLGTVALGSSDKGDVWAHYESRTTTGQVSLLQLSSDLTLLNSWHFEHVPAFGGPFVIYNGLLAGTNASALSPEAAYVWDLSTLGGTNTLVGSMAIGSALEASGLARLFGGYCLCRTGVISLDPVPQLVTLSSIVADLSSRAGLAPSQYDTSGLPDLVRGYLVSQQRAVRDDILPLRQAYFFDAVEVDDKVVFVKRGGASAVSIPDEDMAAFAEGGGASPPPVLATDRSPEFDLPVQVSVNYVNAEADYQTGTQQTQRQVSGSQTVVTIDLPISLSDDDAKAIAQKQLETAWLERDAHSILVPRKYSAYVPTDVITAHGVTLQIRDKSEAASGVIKLDGVPSLSGVFLQAPKSTAGSGFTPSTPGAGGGTATGATTAVLMDLPLVDDVDPPNGFYAALSGGAGWPGGALYKSSDGGASYSSVLSESDPQTIGTATSALGTYLGGNTFDQVNSVTVVTTGGSLSSATQLAVLNGANEAAIGAEIVQFCNATLIAPNTYVLTGLLRGRRGTEWAMSHSAGETFVLLPAPRVAMAPSEFYLARQYKPVTFGGTVAAAIAQSFTNTNNGTKPYAPVLLGGGVDPSGNVTCTWTRRTRIGGAWLPFVDVPLSESVEQYIASFWNSSYALCASWYLCSVPAITFAASTQVAQFGAQQKTIYFSVVQLGSYGPGYQARGSAPGAGASNNDPLSPIVPYGS